MIFVPLVFQFVILVVDSTDRERLPITKEELYKMLAHEVSFTQINTHRDGLVVSVSASHAIGRRFVPWLVHTKDHHKNGANCLPAWLACIRVGVCCTGRLFKRPGSVWN